MRRKMMSKLKDVLTGKRPLVDVLHYLLGNYRYKLFYPNVDKKHFLMRRHIYEQIKFRIEYMNKECYEQGSCIKCGCETTQLQMANKRCDGKCYPNMMGKKEWEDFKVFWYI